MGKTKPKPMLHLIMPRRGLVKAGHHPSSTWSGNSQVLSFYPLNTRNHPAARRHGSNGRTCLYSRAAHHNIRLGACRSRIDSPADSSTMARLVGTVEGLDACAVKAYAGLQKLQHILFPTPSSTPSSDPPAPYAVDAQSAEPVVAQIFQDLKSLQCRIARAYHLLGPCPPAAPAQPRRPG